MGFRPPTQIKKEDRLESLLCPIVNRRKLFIKRKQTELVDEMFQFPKGKNDDVLDGLWYAINNARPPSSIKFDAEKFDEMMERKDKASIKRKVVSWMTGQRI